MNPFLYSLLLAAGLALSTNTNASLLVNGDFELGNTGFASQYSYAPSPTGAEGYYVVSADTRALHPGATIYGDHTTGSGNMLTANGATTPNLYVWSQEVSVISGTDYLFSGWATSWGHFGDGIDVNPARLALLANDRRIGDEFVVERVNGNWTRFEFGFNSGSDTNIVLRLFDTNTAGAPNDFSLDDLSLDLRVAPSQIPEPSSLALIGLALAGIGAARRQKLTN